MRVKINNLVWTVVVDENLDDNLFGLTDMINLTIYLTPKMCKQNIRPTIIHELVHAVTYSNGIYINENEKSYISKEQLCEFVAMHLDTISKLADKIESKLFKK